MKITTKKIEAGLYAVYFDGALTDLVVGIGPAPKYRQGQTWCIGRGPADDRDWMIGDQRSLAQAVSTITIIATAATLQPAYRRNGPGVTACGSLGRARSRDQSHGRRGSLRATGVGNQSWSVGMTIAALQDRDDVIIYSAGVVCCSACAPKHLTPDQVTEAVNAQLPTGLDHGWSVSNDTTFKSGETNPCQCSDDDGRLHYLFNC